MRPALGDCEVTTAFRALTVVCHAIATVGVSAADRYTRGHGDFSIRYFGGNLQLAVHVGGGGIVNGSAVAADVYLNPVTTNIVVPSASAKPRPAGAAYDFIGVAAGARHWRLPQTGINAALERAPFFGISTETIQGGTFVGNVVNVSLLSIVSGPVGGHFSLYQDGPTRLMDTIDGALVNDSFAMPLFGHDHFNWTFTQSGFYQIAFRVSGTHAVDGYKQADATFTFEVRRVDERPIWIDTFAGTDEHFAGPGPNFNGSPAPEPAGILAAIALTCIFGRRCLRTRRPSHD